ncbi:MAG TPA: ribosome biogenesis GTPase Der [Candidatus Saccharimonadales bacterium]|nr:ribosome biogenesis GTPase Der [Candidatus Saccharimonadales bacterium]
MSLMPKVVIVGRTNVGKSSLFNRIAPKVKSLTLDMEGVTRDMITDFVEWNGVKFELIDTGGIDLCKKADEMTCAVTQRVKKALEDAALLLFVVDAQTGIAEQDMLIRNFLHGLHKPVFVLVNKVDTMAQEENIFQFYKFGFEEVIGVSAAHGRSIADLLDKVVAVISQVKPTTKVMDEEPEFKVAFLGRPNAGKSSLMNLLLDQDFSIVSPIAGTTREALRKRIAFNKQVVELIDTAGVRRKSGVTTELESMMVTNALQAAKRAHIVLLMIDVQEPELSAQELKLTSYAFENGSAVIVVFNKTDLLDEEKQQYLDSSLQEYKYFLKKLETINISCKTGKNVGKVLPLVQKVWEKFGVRFSDRYLTDLFMDALVKTPLYKNGQRLTFHKAHQIGTAPLRIELIVRNTEIFEENHRAFFENILRKAQDLKSVPIFFYAKAKKDVVSKNT